MKRTTTPLFPVALAATFLAFGPTGHAQTAEAPAGECAASPSKIVDSVPCASFEARLYCESPGCGIESRMLLGPIDPENVADRSLALDKLAEPVVAMNVVANPVRDGRTIIFPIADPKPPSFVLFRTPATVHTTPDDEVRIRSMGAPGSGTVFIWRSLTDPGGGRVLWREMGASRWTLVLFVNDWRLLD